MFVPFVPAAIVPHRSDSNTTVVNKTIVYSDTVLPLKDSGKNLKVTSISKVSEFELESCLETIFESNQDVIFNTVQYSKNDKKVYFYTDKEITTKEWEERKIFKYKPITNKKEILEELKNILSTSKSKDPNVVSLLDVHNILYNKKCSYNIMKEEIENKIDGKLESLYGDDAYCIIYSFDYDNNIMKIGFKLYDFRDKDTIEFTKRNGDLYIVKADDNLYANNHLANFGSELSELYDKFLLYKDYMKGIKFETPLENSNFKVNIFSDTSISIFDKSYSSEFLLRKSVKDNKFSYDCNSYEIISLIKGVENELFSKLYINIENCPKWMQEELRITRYNSLVQEDKNEKELAERKRIEELDRQLEERKKQKRLELKRKIFPWIK